MKKDGRAKPRQVDKPIKVLEDYYNYNYRSTTPFTEACIERIAKDLVEFANKEDSLTARAFCASIGVTQDQFDKWVKKYPLIGDAYRYAKDRFLDRREVGGLTNRLNSSFAWNSLAFYGEDWKQFMEWKALMAKKEPEQDKDIVIKLVDIRKEVEPEFQQPKVIVVKDIEEKEDDL